MDTATEKSFLEEVGPKLGTIAIRVVVLPPKIHTSGTSRDDDGLLDQEEHEDFLVDKNKTPVGSYLENDRGRRCVVFLVNGQTQDYFDNSFIVNELGFKYLRNRMIISIDVDELSPETIGRLMQSSRQGFFRGHIFDSIKKKIVATLKDDPDLDRLEKEAESQIAELQAGDAKVKEYLDQLIDDHHNQGMHLAEGAGAQGQQAGDQVSDARQTAGNVVSLFGSDVGETKDYPVLVPEPSIVSFRLRPNITRTVLIKSSPLHAWKKLAKITPAVTDDVPELQVSLLHLPDRAEFTICFKEPQGFDPSNYPIHTKVTVTGKFEDIDEPRQITFGVTIKPDKEVIGPELFDPPTILLVSSRQPIKIKNGVNATHVRLRWDGMDHLLTGARPAWGIHATVVDGPPSAPEFTFSNPSGGRFDLLVRAPSDWDVGTRAKIKVEASGPNEEKLEVTFDCEVVECVQQPEPEPRLVEGNFPAGASRRPPYALKYVYENDWPNILCWSAAEWSGFEPACYQEPTASHPLTIIINNDLTALKTYKNLLIKEKKAESEIERRVTKYTSHIAFHVYQMYLAARGVTEEDYDAAEQRRRKEIERVAMTLIKLMEVSR